MTLKELEIFYQLCDMQHTSKLAQKLNMSQSAISLSIKSLENSLEEQLFDRIGKKLILNERGKEFKTQTQKHYEALLDAKDMFQDQKIKGELTVCVSKTINSYIFPQIIYEFIKTHPEVKINKTTHNSNDIEQMVLNANADLGLIESNIKHDHTLYEELMKDELIIVSSDESLSQQPLYIDNLYNKDWILREDGSGTKEMFFSYLKELAHNLNVVLQSTQFEEIKSLVLNNPEAITCISKSAVQNELNNQTLFKVNVINFEFKRSFYFIHHKSKFKTQLFKEFEQFCIHYFKSIQTV